MINLVIPAAGAATRLRPLSSNTSKIMVRVNGKPCLDYIIEQATKIAEVGEIVIVDGQFSDIREYCERKHPNVKCVRQKSLDGPRDAIKIGINNLSDVSQPLVVWLGDAIILEVERLRRENPELESFFKHHDGDEFFIKKSSF